MWIQAVDRKYLVSSLQCRGSWIVGIWPLHHVRVMTDTDSDSGSPPSISQPSGGADNVFSLATGRKILFLLHKTGRKQPGGGKSGPINPVSKHYHPQSSKPIILLIIDYPNLFTKFRPDPVKIHFIPTKRAEVKCLN